MGNLGVLPLASLRLRARPWLPARIARRRVVCLVEETIIEFACSCGLLAARAGTMSEDPCLVNPLQR
jgi:hypothetical protein